MKPLPASLLAAALGAAGLLAAAPSEPARTDSLESALANGKFSFDARLRGESADQANLRSAEALTLRTLFGFTTAPWAGFQGMIEGENVARLNDSGDYSAAGTNADGAGRTVIADPPATDLNQAWLSYTTGGTTVKAGRQRIVLDHARFVGDVGWRQNMQTFDAATLTLKPVTALTAYYGYVSRVSRVFGNLAPQPDFTSDSHLLNLAYAGLPGGTLTAYAYLLDFKNSAPNSSDTYGASYAGTYAANKTVKVTYRAETAIQHDARNNPLSYTAHYYLGELGLAAAPFDAGVGYEVLGSDGGRKGFATPLATLHAFNGWADLFLTTPAAGLRDTYVSAGVALPGGFPVKVVYHQFRSDFGAHNYGNEVDALVTHKLGQHWSVLAKAAHYDGKPPFFDTNKAWLQVEYTF